MERWRPIAVLLAVALLVSCFSGCLGSEKEKSVENEQPTVITNTNLTSYKPHVVVALIDTAINPYHEIFGQENLTCHPSTFIDGYPEEALPINITLDDAYHAEDECWDNVTHDILYYIPGTKIVGAIGHALGHDAVPTLENGDGNPVLADKFHGTEIAGIISELCPEAYIVMVKDSNFRKALDWTAKQSWIDVISMSRIYYGDFNQSDFDPLYSSDILDSLDVAVSSGKIVIAGAGNRPYPSFITLPQGHPGVIIAGGAMNETKGEAVVASKTPDFVAQFYSTRLADYVSYNKYATGCGTSISAPYLASAFASVILELRTILNDTNPHSAAGLVHGAASSGYLSDGVITNFELRDAFNKTAIYWDSLSYSPQNHPIENDTSIDGGLLAWSDPIIPFPFIQMGWGYVSPAILNETIDILLGKKQYEPSLEKQLAEPYMNAIYELRKQFWENYPLETT